MTSIHDEFYSYCSWSKTWKDNSSIFGLAISTKKGSLFTPDFFFPMEDVQKEKLLAVRLRWVQEVQREETGTSKSKIAMLKSFPDKYTPEKWTNFEPKTHPNFVEIRNIIGSPSTKPPSLLGFQNVRTFRGRKTHPTCWIFPVPPAIDLSRKKQAKSWRWVLCG